MPDGRPPPPTAPPPCPPGAEYFPGLQYTDFDDPKLSVVLHQTLALAQTDIVVLASPTTVLTQAFVAAHRLPHRRLLTAGRGGLGALKYRKVGLGAVSWGIGVDFGDFW